MDRQHLGIEKHSEFLSLHTLKVLYSNMFFNFFVICPAAVDVIYALSKMTANDHYMTMNDH